MQQGQNKLSKLTLGTVQLGMSYGIANKSGMPTEDESAKMLQAALDHGIACFDTAGAYGNSEQVLGRFFSSRNEKPLIVSKIRIEADAGTPSSQIAAQMWEHAERSLEHLQIKQVPVMMLHNPDVLRMHERTIIQVLQQMQAEGVIGQAGASMGANIDEHMRELWPILQTDLFEAIQVPINILDHRLLYNEGLARMKQRGKTVFARSIFLQGLLFLQDEELPPYLQQAKEPLELLRQLSRRYQLPLAQMAFSFVRDLPAIDSLVVGAETLGQLEENAALLAGPALPDQLRTEILQAFRHVPEQVVNTVRWQ